MYRYVPYGWNPYFGVHPRVMKLPPIQIEPPSQPEGAVGGASLPPNGTQPKPRPPWPPSGGTWTPKPITWPPQSPITIPNGPTSWPPQTPTIPWPTTPEAAQGSGSLPPTPWPPPPTSQNGPTSWPPTAQPGQNGTTSWPPTAQPGQNGITSWPPSSSQGTASKPPVMEEEEFVHNGKRYKCKWVYCCSPVEHEDVSIPDCKAPGPNEGQIQINFVRERGVPQFKARKCDNQYGFCLDYRESEFTIYGRIVYPKNLEEKIKEEIRKCLEKAAIEAGIVLAAFVAEMVAVPPSTPAVLPVAMKTAFQTGRDSFIKCIKTNFTLKNLFDKGQIKYCVGYDQKAYGDYRPLTSRDLVKLMDKIAFMGLGPMAALIPGVGSFEDVANKLGIDTEKLNDQITGGLQHAGEEGQKVIDKLTNWKVPEVKVKNPFGRDS